METPEVNIRSEVCIETSYGTVCAISFDGFSDAREHVAIRYGAAPCDVSWPLIRIHSECLTGDLFHSSQCDCGPQLDEARRRCRSEGGFIFYLRQEGRGIGLYAKLEAYLLQQQGIDTYAANEHLGFEADGRDFQIAADMCRALNIRRCRLLTNNPSKVAALENAGIAVRQVTTGVYLTPANTRYLSAKRTITNHSLELPIAKEA